MDLVHHPMSSLELSSTPSLCHPRILHQLIHLFGFVFMNKIEEAEIPLKIWVGFIQIIVRIVS